MADWPDGRVGFAEAVPGSTTAGPTITTSHTCAWPLILAHPHLDLGRVALNPVAYGGRANLDISLLHHLDKVAAADPVFAIPAHAQQDNLDGKATAPPPES
jgi:hypothetical protein